MLKYTLTFTHTEVGLLIEALTKASARHTSHAKFYPGRQQAKHKEVASCMTRLSERLQATPRDLRD
jgi:hypothetical protein